MLPAALELRRKLVKAALVGSPRDALRSDVMFDVRANPRKNAEIDRGLELATLVESLPDGVLIVDEHGVIREVNSAAKRLLEYESEPLRGASLAQIAGQPGTSESGQTPIEEMLVVRALQGEHIRDQLKVFHNSAGDEVEVLLSANPLQRGDTIVGAVLVMRDVTETRQLRRSLDESERHSTVGHLAAGLAHDFNNVLDAIDKAAALLEMQPLVSTEQRHEYLQLIREGVRRGAEIMHTLRLYLREGGPKPAPMRIDEMLRDTIELTRPLWEGAGLHLRTHIERVPPVRGRATDLRRVFANLLINAVEATPAGGEIRVRCNARGSSVFAVVQDTGRGVPPHIQKQIFYPYFTTKASGTGLGLSGALRIVHAHGGDVRLESAEGHGARFTVELPAMLERNHQPNHNGNGNGAGEVPRAA